MKTIISILLVTLITLSVPSTSLAGLKKPCDNKKGIEKCDAKGHYICKNGHIIKAEKKCNSKEFLTKKKTQIKKRKVFIDY